MNKQQVSAEEFRRFVESNVTWNMETYLPLHDPHTAYAQHVIFLAMWATRDFEIVNPRPYRNNNSDIYIDIKRDTQKMITQYIDELEVIVNWENHTPGMRDSSRRRMLVTLLSEALYKDYELIQTILNDPSGKGIRSYVDASGEADEVLVDQIELWLRRHTITNTLAYPSRRREFLRIYEFIKINEMNNADARYLLTGSESGGEIPIPHAYPVPDKRMSYDITYKQRISGLHEAVSRYEMKQNGGDVKKADPERHEKLVRSNLFLDERRLLYTKD